MTEEYNESVREDDGERQRIRMEGVRKNLSVSGDTLIRSDTLQSIASCEK